ncbi:hypothetical protein HAX54_034265, partial [Datura stramonium]|nr:hypothetical protein [Datura stramonium]
HALEILNILNVKDMIPTHYILKRWTKNVINMHGMDVNLVGKDSDSKVEVIARYSKEVDMYDDACVDMWPSLRRLVTLKEVMFHNMSH